MKKLTFFRSALCVFTFFTLFGHLSVLFSEEVVKDTEERAVPALTFDDALSRVMSANESITAARFEYNKREHDKSAAFGMYFPKIEVKANAVKMDQPVVMDLNDIRTAILKVQQATLQGAGVNPAIINAVSQQTASGLPSFEKTLIDSEYATADLAASWPIFTGGKIVIANKAASARIEESRYKITDIQNRLVTELAERYFGLRLSERVVEVRKLALDGMNEHLVQAKSLETNGMIARVERLHAEVAFADADREYKKSVRDCDLARTALSNSLSEHTIADPTTPLFVFNEIKPLDYYQQLSIEKNPLLQQISINKQLAHLAYTKELAEYSPTIFLFGTYTLYDYHAPELLPKWIAGAGASCTIFEGFSGYEKAKAAKDQESQVETLFFKARKDILTLVEKNYQELMLALEQYHSIDASYRFAEEYLRVREKAFTEGSATSLDVVDAQLAFSKVKIDRLKSVYDFDIALAALLEVSGESQSYASYIHSSNKEAEF